PAVGVGERTEASEVGGDAGAVDVVPEVVYRAQFLGEGVPVIVGVGVIDPRLVEQVLVVDDRQRVEVLGNAVDLALDGVDLHEAGDDRAGMDQVRDRQDLAGGDDAGRGLAGDVEDVPARTGRKGVGKYLVVVGLDGLVLDRDALGGELLADHLVEQALHYGR